MTSLTADAQSVAPPEPLPFDAPVPDILDRAADVIERDGLWQGGDFWRDSHSRRWTPGEPCCTVGTIGVLLARTTAAAVACDFIPAVLGDPWGDDLPHPAISALMAYLHVNLPELFRWSDTSEPAWVASVMRECAASLRTVTA